MDVGTLRTPVTSGPPAGAKRRSLGAATRRKTVTRGAGCLSRARPDLRGEALGRSMVISTRARRWNAGYSQERAYRPHASALSRPPIGEQFWKPIDTVEIPVNYRFRSFDEGKKVSLLRDPFLWLEALSWLRVVRIDPLCEIERQRKERAIGGRENLECCTAQIE
jgi:hypothetical protein